MHPLRNKNFRLLLGTQVFGSLSASFFEIPIFWWLIETTGSGSIVALTAFVSSVAYLIAAPWGGVWADKVSKKRIVISAYAVDAGLTALAAYLLLIGQLTLAFLLILLAITNLLTAFRSPSLGSLLPLLIEKSRYQEGNAAMGLATTVATLLSAAAAGVATATLGVSGAIFLGAGFIMVALGFMCFLEEPVAKAVPSASSQQAPALMAGFKVLRDNPLLAVIVFMATLLNFILSPLTVLFAPYVLELGASAAGFGFLSAMVALGQLLGLIALNIIKIKQVLRVLTVGTFSIATALLALAFAPTLLFAVLAISVLGLSASIMGVTISTLFQERIPPDVLGRSMGLMSALTQAAQPAGFVAAAGLLTVTSVRRSFIMLGILMSLAATVWLRPRIKKQFHQSAAN